MRVWGAGPKAAEAWYDAGYRCAWQLLATSITFGVKW